MPWLILGSQEQYRTRVSEEDYAYLTQWRWTFKRSSKKYAYAIYGRRCTTIKGVKTTILLSHVILERFKGPRPSKKHTADHKSGDTLDDRRSNLDWRTKRQQSNNMTPRRRAYLERGSARA